VKKTRQSDIFWIAAFRRDAPCLEQAARKFNIARIPQKHGLRRDPAWHLPRQGAVRYFCVTSPF
jgi:hypothetical protein